MRRESLTPKETSASDPGLNWFHSLTSPDEWKAAFPASPIRSSTQNHTASTSCSNVLPSNSGSAHGEGSAWEKQANEDSSSVVQKTSKKLRTKRLKKLNTERVRNEGRSAVEERLNAEQRPSSDTLPFHSTPMADRKRPSKREAASFSPPVMEQSESEKPQVDLSSFAFRSRERMIHTDQAAVSDPVPKMDKRGHKCGTAPSSRTRQNEKKENECCEQPAEGSSVCKKLRIQVQAKIGEVPSENGPADDAENKRRELFHSLSSTAPKEPAFSAQPRQPKTKVASSTLAKLSAFSFVPSPEEKTGQNLTAAPTQENNTLVSKDGVMEKDASPARSAHSSTATLEQKSSADPAAGSCPKASRPDTKPEMCEDQSESSRKRKCFDLSSARPGALFSALSFFSSSIVDDEALDVDWEEESRIRAPL